MNTDKIFQMTDENGNIISKVIDYKDEEKDCESKFVLIANNNMLLQLKNNYIAQFFMDCTYKSVSPNTFNFRLMTLFGFDTSLKKTVLCLFVLISKESEKTFERFLRIDPEGSACFEGQKWAEGYERRAGRAAGGG